MGIKTLRGLLHDIGLSFVQERVHPGRHMIIELIIGNESSGDWIWVRMLIVPFRGQNQ